MYLPLVWPVSASKSSCLRAYWPDQAVLNGRWNPPPIVKAVDRFDRFRGGPETGLSRTTNLGLTLPAQFQDS
jgi:hypothetical protein